MRYARGIRNAALVQGTGLNATSVTQTITANTAKLDVNGNGLFDVDDASMITRTLFAFAGDRLLINGSAGAYASRIDAKVIKSFIDNGCQVQPLQTSVSAARFLTQASYGISNQDLIAFNALAGADIKAKATSWLNQQIAMPRSGKHFDYIAARYAAVDAVNYGVPPRSPDNFDRFYNDAMRHSFWQQTLKHPDQLRQRMAFALSQIMVVSAYGGSNDAGELAAYLDILADGAFGNFRDLLYNVSRSVAMGNYLNHLRNDGNSETPNENFARELLQLFSVGLTQLNIDGSNVSGNPPTYTEDMVKGFARVFTGFSFDDPFTAADGGDRYGNTHPMFFYYPNNDGETYLPSTASRRQRERVVYGKPMKPFAGKHSKAAKPLLKYSYANPVGTRCTNAVAFASGAAILPALDRTPPPNEYGHNGTTTQDALTTLDAGIDNIFCHPNVGPFISKALIRFFVTSNPSPSYVQRVAEKFNNNGANVRGDMSAVIRAILLDDEAMTPQTYSAAGYDYNKFGKLKEPIVRLSALLRAFGGTTKSGRYEIDNLNSVEYGINQGPLQSPSVFNFFHPEFVPPGRSGKPMRWDRSLRSRPRPRLQRPVTILATLFGEAIQVLSCNNRASCTRETARHGTAPRCAMAVCIRICRRSTPFGKTRAPCSITSISFCCKVACRAMHARATPLRLTPRFPVAVLPSNPSAYEMEVWQRLRQQRVKGAMWLMVHSPEFQIQR